MSLFGRTTSEEAGRYVCPGSRYDSAVAWDTWPSAELEYNTKGFVRLISDKMTFIPCCLPRHKRSNMPLCKCLLPSLHASQRDTLCKFL